jgi:hypothetical protein
VCHHPNHGRDPSELSDADRVGSDGLRVSPAARRAARDYGPNRAGGADAVFAVRGSRAAGV